jgi:hypothetical protein
MDVRQLRALMLTSVRAFSDENKESGSDSKEKSTSDDKGNPLTLMGTYSKWWSKYST